MSDKSKELNTSITLINEKLHFKSTVGENEPLSIDYTALLGDNLGYTSEDDLKKVLKLSEETYCPVWAMLKGNVNVEAEYNIVS